MKNYHCEHFTLFNGTNLLFRLSQNKQLQHFIINQCRICDLWPLTAVEFFPFDYVPHKTTALYVIIGEHLLCFTRLKQTVAITKHRQITASLFVLFRCSAIRLAFRCIFNVNFGSLDRYRYNES